jgi:sporulation protein YlmC with PRC-barrel domain
MLPQSTTSEPHTLVSSDRVEGTPVVRPDGTKIGTIKRVMIDKRSGEVAYAVLSFGGFLGVGEKYCPVAWERLTYDPALGGYAVDLTDADMAAASSDHTAFDWGDRTAEIPTRPPAYWGAY